MVDPPFDPQMVSTWNPKGVQLDFQRLPSGRQNVPRNEPKMEPEMESEMKAEIQSFFFVLFKMLLN